MLQSLLQAKIMASFKRMDELVYGNASYCNVMVQIVSCYRNIRGNIVLHVWDGTKNDIDVFSTSPHELKLIYGDEERERLIAAKKKIYEVLCYDNHGQVVSKFKAGDYIALINVHFYIPTRCYIPTLIMHSGSGNIKSAIAILKHGRRIVKITKGTASAEFDVIDGLIKKHEGSLGEEEDEEESMDVDLSPFAPKVVDTFGPSEVVDPVGPAGVVDSVPNPSVAVESTPAPEVVYSVGSSGVADSVGTSGVVGFVSPSEVVKSPPAPEVVDSPTSEMVEFLTAAEVVESVSPFAPPANPSPQSYVERNFWTEENNEDQENSEDCPTQALLDKLHPIQSTTTTQASSVFEKSSSFGEENGLNAITVTQMNKMWNAVENAELNPSFPMTMTQYL